MPSRTQKGSFYALPQSPQLFKQPPHGGGFERYFQIVRCFRDEDLRADRQPEFTQIDIEMSFADQDDVSRSVEGLFVHMLGAVGIEASAPFPRLTWAEAMDRYGTDKPDLRYGLEIADVSKVFSGSGYGIFEKVIAGGGTVRAMVAPACSGYSRKDIDGLEKLAKSQGAAGLGWARWTDAELSSPMSKHVGEARLKEAFEQAKGGPGDLLLLVAGEERQALVVLGALRLEVARRENLAKPGTWRLAWITEFPLFEWNETSKQWTSSHHPFTSPHPDDLDRLESDPGSVRSLAYDVVACGYELGSGSIRIHRADVQSRHLPGAWDRRRGGAGEVRLLLGSASIRSPATRRHRARFRSHRHDCRWRHQSARRHRVPQDDIGRGFDGRLAVSGHQGAASRAGFGPDQARSRKKGVRPCER